MFARSALRAAQPLKRAAFRRTYATEPPPAAAAKGGSSNNALLYGAGAVGAAGAGYWYFGASGAQKAEAKVKDAVAGPPKKAFLGGDQGFISLVLKDVETINHNTKKLIFQLPEDDQVSGMQITSALLTKFKPEGAEKPIIRPYTPTSEEDTKGLIELIVKKYPEGPMSTHLHDMIPGQRLDFKGPLPKYPWTANKHKHIALIAGGTGITPMYQLARAIFRNADDQTKVTLVFGNLTEQDVLLKREWEDLENTYPQRFRAFYTLDKPPKGWTGGVAGHITKDLLKTVLPEPKEENIKIFVCGPPGLYKAISGGKVSPADQGELTGYLKELGYSKDQVFKF